MGGEGGVAAAGGDMPPVTCSVTFRVNLPAGTPVGSIFIAGASIPGDAVFGESEWEPNAAEFELTRDGASAEITLEVSAQTGLDYKFTRGSWESVETDLNCVGIENRRETVLCPDGDLIFEHEILGWADDPTCPPPGP